MNTKIVGVCIFVCHLSCLHAIFPDKMAAIDQDEIVFFITIDQKRCVRGGGEGFVADKLFISTRHGGRRAENF